MDSWWRFRNALGRALEPRLKSAKEELRIVKSALKTSVAIVFVGIVVLWLGNYVFNPKARYAFSYDVSESQVFMENKPHDCEWDKAPIGNKYCHYEAVVTTAPDTKGNKAVYVTWTRIQE